MENNSIFLLRSKSKHAPHLNCKISRLMTGSSATDDSDFVTAYKTVYNTVYSSTPKGHLAMKEKEDLLVQNIDLIGRGLEVTNNSNEANRRSFINFKMHRLFVYVMDLYLTPKYELPQFNIHNAGTNKVVGAVLGMLEKLCKVDEDRQFHTEIAYYDPLILSLFDCLEKLENCFKRTIFVLELLLQFRDEVFPIAAIPNFWSLMTKINKQKDIDKLGSVSKVIALLILDRHKKMFSEMFEKQYLLRLFPNPRTIDINECILIRLPNLVENLTHYLAKHCKKLSS